MAGSPDPSGVGTPAINFVRHVKAMAYLPNNASIGPNSLEASDIVCNGHIAEANGQAALGRLAAFLTTPDPSSFRNPTLAANAARILMQSREGRASLLSASAPAPVQHAERVNLGELIADAPEVLPLNSVPMCGAVARRVERVDPPQMVMPQRAPVSVRIAPQTPPVYLPAPPVEPQTYAAPPSDSGPAPSLWSPVSVGPGGPGVQSWNVPATGLVMEDGGLRYMGYSGYAPPWGDAGLVDMGPMPDESGGGWFKAALIVGGLVILGGAVGAKARKRRLRR